MPNVSHSGLQRFRFLCTDKLTGRVFHLCAEGESETLAAEKIWALGFLISSAELCPWVLDPSMKPQTGFRGEEWYEDQNHLIGKVHAARLKDFSESVQEINTDCDIEDRHWLLTNLIVKSERSKHPAMYDLCELLCWQWFVERHEITNAVVSRRPDGQKIMYEVPAVNRLRIMHDGERKAQVCDFATDMKYQLPNHAWLLKKSRDYRTGKH